MHNFSLQISEEPYYFGEEDFSWRPLGFPANDKILQMGLAGRPEKSLGYASYGWHKNSFSDPDIMMKAGGMMKAPASYMNEFLEKKPAREVPSAGRRILGTMLLESNKTYYIRIQSVHNEPSEIFLDYLELVPAEVYANPLRTEDIW